MTREWTVSNAYVSARFVELPDGNWKATTEVPLEIREVLEEPEAFFEVVPAPRGIIADVWRPARLKDHPLGTVLGRFMTYGFTVEQGPDQEASAGR